MILYRKILFYYLLILSAFLGICWIIWARFIRERTIREIPDYLLTEYRFWILLYLCLIYSIICIILIISLLNLKKNNYKNNLFKELLEFIYIPFKMLDHAIKYNKYINEKYCMSLSYISNKLYHLKNIHFMLIVIIFQVIPRILLMTFLLMDTFYFHKLELFYKIVLLGFLPFFFKYFKYTFKDFKEHHTKLLEYKYKEVLLFDEASIDLNRDEEWELTKDNNFHNKEIPVKEYIEFKIQQRLYGTPNISYNEYPFVNKYIYDEYKKINNIPENVELSTEMFEHLNKDFYIYCDIICNSAIIYEKFNYTENKKIILSIKLNIYFTYFICWAYILIISYYYYPVEFDMFINLVINFTEYLKEFDDPFYVTNKCSRNENLITIENILQLLKHIFNKIFKIK